MPPGFAHQCPYGLELPIPVTPWVVGLWVVVYALWAETMLLGLGLLVLQLRRNVPRGAAISLLLVTACAAGAIAVAFWMTNHNIQSCSALPLPVHVTLPLLMRARRLQSEFLMQARITLGVQAALAVLGTALTVVTLVRGWQRSRRGGKAARA